MVKNELITVTFGNQKTEKVSDQKMSLLYLKNNHSSEQVIVSIQSCNWTRSYRILGLLGLFFRREIVHCCLQCFDAVGWARKDIRPVKNLSGGLLAWLSVWSKMQTCIWPS